MHFCTGFLHVFFAKNLFDLLGLPSQKLLQTPPIGQSVDDMVVAPAGTGGDGKSRNAVTETNQTDIINHHEKVLTIEPRRIQCDTLFQNKNFCVHKLCNSSVTQITTP
ncbi:hypothetical protein KP509_12G019900 [Ceratopteris richardii]|nr:hypothetical protein KP509_12G019900 [Ceratopteris richardii]